MDSSELTFGEKVRYLREKLCLSQVELGGCLQMTQRKISYMETGRYEPGIEDIRRLCRFFRVSADYLLGLPDTKT